MNTLYKNFEDLPLMLNVQDIVSVLGISRAFAYNLLHDQSLPVVVIGKRRLVNRDKFFTWLESCEHNRENVLWQK